MGIFSWIIVGGLAGWISGKIMGTGKSLGWIATIILGIIGGFIGGILVGLLGGTGVTGFNVWSILVSVLGSVVFIWIAQKIKTS